MVAGCVLLRLLMFRLGGEPKVGASQMLPRCSPDAPQMLFRCFQPRCVSDASSPHVFQIPSGCLSDISQVLPDASQIIPSPMFSSPALSCGFPFALSRFFCFFRSVCLSVALAAFVYFFCFPLLAPSSFPSFCFSNARMMLSMWL